MSEPKKRKSINPLKLLKRINPEELKVEIEKTESQLEALRVLYRAIEQRQRPSASVASAESEAIRTEPGTLETKIERVLQRFGKLTAGAISERLSVNLDDVKECVRVSPKFRCVQGVGVMLAG